MIFSQLGWEIYILVYFCFKMINDFLMITAQQMNYDASEDLVDYVGDNFFVAGINCRQW
jgi:hypothetical protein